MITEIKDGKMEHLNTPTGGFLSLVVTLMSAFIAWVGFLQAKDIVVFTASCVSILAGIMATRYYYHATKKINNNK